MLVVGAVALLAGALSAQPISQGPASLLLGPIQQAFTNLGRTLGGLFRDSSDLVDLRTRVEALRRQVTALEAENIRLREFQAEIKQYRDLLRFASDNPTYEVVGADVIGMADMLKCEGVNPQSPTAGKCANVIAGDPSPFVRYITINAGARDGIEVGMPVVAGGLALVGRVGKVSHATAQVQLLTDPASFVNVRMVESRASGTVAGTSEGILLLQNVLQTEPLKPGDLIVTSGLGGMLPQGLPIGAVERVISQDVETTQQAIVRPGVDFDKLEVVLVITRPRAAQLLTPAPASPAR
ncbi:MAG: rod shape-determining protein MreC [Chloroflexi bacterium]|jgi:rod shape-determining protein MreC|nr:rod shape-determining protein MreC [Chloroflexota bacterium]